MKLVEILKPDFVFQDERGTLCQITHSPFAQVNTVFSKKNSVRGNYHYHKTADEVFYVISGEVEVEACLDGKSELHTFRTGDMFAVLKNVRHRFDYKKDTHLVVLYTSGIELEDGTKDIIYEDGCAPSSEKETEELSE